MEIRALINVLLALVLSPLLLGIINRTKAAFGGRKGPPLLQAYFDLRKLLRKGAVYSRTTTWIFRAAPAVTAAAMASALLLVPFGGQPGILPFSGDLFLFAYLLGLARLFTVLAALDTGSSFEGMGASREVQFAVMAEPAFLLALAALAAETGQVSLSGIYSALSWTNWLSAGPAFFLALVALVVVLLAENSRIPFDDPSTHLELTMIHEVMILDYSGPDLAAMLYASSLKLWLLGAIIIGLVLPGSGNAVRDTGAFLAGMAGLAVTVGIIESVMARARLLRVPQLLAGAAVLSILAVTFSIQ
jgi:formate hydrogenlyase subunit 4